MFQNKLKYNSLNEYIVIIIRILFAFILSIYLYISIYIYLCIVFSMFTNDYKTKQNSTITIYIYRIKFVSFIANVFNYFILISLKTIENYFQEKQKINHQ